MLTRPGPDSGDRGANCAQAGLNPELVNASTLRGMNGVQAEGDAVPATGQLADPAHLSSPAVRLASHACALPRDPIDAVKPMPAASELQGTKAVPMALGVNGSCP